MAATLNDVTTKESKQLAEQQAAVELVLAARAQDLSLTGPGNLLKQFSKAVLETSLNKK